jgi:hypothetical protein
MKTNQPGAEQPAKKRHTVTLITFRPFTPRPAHPFISRPTRWFACHTLPPTAPLPECPPGLFYVIATTTHVSGEVPVEACRCLLCTLCLPSLPCVCSLSPSCSVLPNMCIIFCAGHGPRRNLMRGPRSVLDPVHASRVVVWVL